MDLIQGGSMPNIAHHRSSLVKNEDLNKQVEDLLN